MRWDKVRCRCRKPVNPALVQGLCFVLAVLMAVISWFALRDPLLFGWSMALAGFSLGSALIMRKCFHHHSDEVIYQKMLEQFENIVIRHKAEQIANGYD